jgi:hypothetical protein
MEQHVKTVAILNIVYAGLCILIGLGILLFFGGLAGVVIHDHDPDAATGAAALGAVGGFVFVIIAVFSLPELIGGIGLLKYKEWARILTIVMSALNLLSIPFGTALGIYGIWALTKDETRSLFKTQTVGTPATS